MKDRKYGSYWKRILAMGLGLSLTFGHAAYGEVLVPPNPLTSEAQNQGTQSQETQSQGTQNQGITVQTGQDPSSLGLPAPGQSVLGQLIPGQTGTDSTVTPGTTQGAAGPGAQTGQTSQTPVVSEGTAMSGENALSGDSTTTGSSDGSSDGNSNSSAADLQEPTVSAEGAVLLDASTGAVLYGKNENQQFYPASITKVMTALLVLERCSLSDVVTFSASATTNLESGAVSLNITEGDQLTVEQCLYGLLLKSANEIGNGLAEHVAGSVSGFADLMNAKAAELGCRNTHFANPHGLNDENHKTTPYDMALILRAALQNDTFRQIATTRTYEFPATKKEAAHTITMGHKMVYPSDSRYYEGFIGGKTGYTSKAGNTLVTGAERNGVRLVAVVMKSNGTHYADTKAMLDYGFENYTALTGRVSQSGSQGTTAQSGEQSPVQSPVQTPGQTSEQSSGEPSNQTSSTMIRGWYQNNGMWYYYNLSDGQMVTSAWIQDGGKWYYLGSNGAMLTNTTTPDGYYVDGSGVWVQ